MGLFKTAVRYPQSLCMGVAVRCFRAEGCKVSSLPSEVQTDGCLSSETDTVECRNCVG